MTVVVDPGGTPAPVYSRSGTTIQTIDTTEYAFADAVQIVSYSQTTVVLAYGGTYESPTGVILPTSPDIGDVVEVYAVGTVGGDYGIVVWDPGSEETLGGVIGPGTNTHGTGVSFRYTGTTYGWLYLVAG